MLVVRTETILNVFPSSDQDRRLVIAMESEQGAEGRLVLRQESFSEDVGWFVQSRIAVEPEQIPGLKMSLSGQVLKPRRRNPRSMVSGPAILPFDHAVAGQAS